jgi:hypothetical protein
MDKNYWKLVAQWSAIEQIEHYAEVVETLAAAVDKKTMPPLEATQKLAGAAFTLRCSPPGTGHVTSSALLADEVSQWPYTYRASQEWPYIVALARKARSLARTSEE